MIYINRDKKPVKTEKVEQAKTKTKTKEKGGKNKNV